MKPPSYHFIKRLRCWCFPVNFGKFLRTPTLKNIWGRLLLHINKISMTANLSYCSYNLWVRLNYGTTHHDHHHPPPPTTSQNISTTTQHNLPSSTTTHHQPKYIHHDPPPSTASQNIFTSTHQHPPPATIYPPPPTTLTQKMDHHPAKARIYSYITFWNCFSSFFFFKMQYSFLWWIFYVIKFWSVCFSNLKFLLHFTLFKICWSYQFYYFCKIALSNFNTRIFSILEHLSFFQN